MAMPAAVTGDTVLALTDGWSVAMSAAGAVTRPDQLDTFAWRPARVPASPAADLGATADEIDAHDIWYRCDLVATGPHSLRLDGLAGHADVFLDDHLRVDHLRVESRSMFVAHDIDFDGTGPHRLTIRVKALTPLLEAASGPRQRWRPMMISPQSLRLLRLSPLGHMPGWAPRIALAGPWQDVRLIRRGAPFRIRALRLIPSLHGARGRLAIDITFDHPVDPLPVLACSGHEAALTRVAPARFSGELILDDVAPWWPHTHGAPALHQAVLRVGATEVDLGRVGFRSLALDRGRDGAGFRLRINGEAVFCRGANWMPPDPQRPGSADPRPLLARAKDAGMNMLRLSGTTMPESDAFYRACDEAGVLIWQDLPFANFDYPTGDPAFHALVMAETRQLMERLQASPALAVVCGGSEIAQQATMLGLKPAQTANPFFEDEAAKLVMAIAPQALYVPHTPWGGPLPFSTDHGVSHYYGVGAYRRPIEDVRRADVRFASECLAFANVPSPARLRAARLSDPAAPRWKSGVPRDLGADWDFETVRDHYVAALYGVDVQALRSADPERYLALGRAAPAELMEAVFAEWRSTRSGCGGGLVWFLNDLVPGAGWGVLDDRGEPKTTWYALRRAFQPLHLGITDEGLNGLAIHAGNETTTERRVKLTLACYGETAHPLAKAEASLTLAPRQTARLDSATLLGRFFDFTYAYRFGPLAHDATVVRLFDADSGERLAEAAHVLAGRAATPGAIGLAAEVASDTDGYALRICAERFARFVTVDDDQFIAGDQGFCLTPGETRLVRLVSRGSNARPAGTVAALNSHPVSYRAS